MSNPDKWNEQLIAHFPTFDPTWPEDVKNAWYAAFEELMERILAEDKKPAKKVKM